MSMPNKLVLIRHGQSEANIINKKVRHGELKEFPESYAKTPDREFRLSDLGREQAKATGHYLKTTYPQGFDVIYVSDHIRARETAALACIEAGWHTVRIIIDPQLGERNWGKYHLISDEERQRILAHKHRDPLHAGMPDGESLLETRNRARVLLERISRQHTGRNVLVFSHGEYIEATWAEIEKMRTERQREFFSGPEGDIKNCQVIEFSSHPITGKFWEVTSSNPYLGEVGVSRPIEKFSFTPEELLAEVETYEKLEVE